MDLGPKIRKTNVGVRIRIVKMPNNLDFFDQNLPKKWILESEIQKSKSGFGICILEILCVPIFRQNG